MPCYNCGAVDSFQWEGGENPMEMLTTFLISVVAGVISYYICKRLDRNK